jgi:anti-anti-sigma factor
MNVTQSQAQGAVPVTILRTHGDLDASSFEGLIMVARQAYEQGARHILLDLGDTPYMSSSGLVALQSIAALLKGEQLPDLEAGWAAIRSVDRFRDGGFQSCLKLLNPQPPVRHVLETVGFVRFLEIYTDEEAAVASF